MHRLVTRFRSWWAHIPPDGRIAMGMVIMLLPVMVLASEDTPPEGDVSRGLDALSWGILLGAGLTLLLRKRFPGTVVVLMMAWTSLWYGLDHTNGLINPLVLIAFYQLGYTGDRRRELGLGIPAILLPLASNLLFDREPIWDRVRGEAWPIDAILWPITAILLGELVRSRKLLMDGYAERAAIAEAERDAEAERQVTEERMRIARDLHDVLAHTVSVMNVQAGVAADTLDRAPETARAALDGIRSAGKDAMTEVGATIAVLRGNDTAGADRHPVPGLDRLPELVENARGQDLEVHFTPASPTDPAPDSLIGLTVYRVVQEALTNVIRHAGATRVDIDVGRHGNKLVVEVSNDGPPATGRSHSGGTRSGGFGLQGMRERVEPLGGTLDYGPRPAGGWSVVAALPLRKSSPRA